MSNDKVLKTKAYINQLKERLLAAVPEKHLNRPEQYKQFLRNEIKTAESILEKISK